MADDSISLYALEDETKSVITTKIPLGGKSGQALVKASNKNYDVRWSDSGGSGGGGGTCNRIPLSDILKLF